MTLKFTPVTEVPQDQKWGRKSRELLSGFLTSGFPRVKVDNGLNTAVNTNMILRAFVANNGLPIKVSMRAGEVHLERTDMADGKVPKAKTIDEYKALSRGETQP